MGFIYLITNDVNEKKYVGLTTLSVQNRWNDHVGNMRAGVDYKLYRAMRKYGIEHFTVKTIDEVQDFHDLCLREQYWIQQYDSLRNGYNCTIGGEGNRLYSQDAIYALWDDGLPVGEIATKLGCTSSTVYLALLSYLNYSREESFRRRTKTLSHSVVQFDLNGTFIAKYTSAVEADVAVGAAKGSISLCCNTVEHCTVKGYLWVWEEDVDKIPELVQELKTKRRRSTPEMQAVAQIDSTGKILAIFDSAKSAAKAFGKTRDMHIGECCRGKRNTCFGYYWRFLNDLQDMGR